MVLKRKKITIKSLGEPFEGKPVKIIDSTYGGWGHMSSRTTYTIEKNAVLIENRMDNLFHYTENDTFQTVLEVSEDFIDRLADVFREEHLYKDPGLVCDGSGTEVIIINEEGKRFCYHEYSLVFEENKKYMEVISEVHNRIPKEFEEEYSRAYAELEKYTEKDYKREHSQDNIEEFIRELKNRQYK